MKKRGILFSLVGLTVGIGIGLGVLALRAFVAQSLTDLLEHEAQKAGGYHFKADKISVSLLALSAKASRPLF